MTCLREAADRIASLKQEVSEMRRKSLPLPSPWERTVVKLPEKPGKAE